MLIWRELKEKRENMTAYEVLKEKFNSDEVATWLLWEQTAFPCCSNEYALKQAQSIVTRHTKLHELNLEPCDCFQNEAPCRAICNLPK